ncbi:Capsular polysaccharide biosynthesis protein-like protein [Methylobacterium sp. 4-46]|uniref:glycosyltransferase family 61 protein n=1 Tax=unclassified Methylobacterium TaxID=2615210 RepID=UPI000152BF17|nr:MULTISPECIES: glycosyltransferase family 61 protein [Methylobacterium]ACA19288.1 Capsular polysaccharide biosynthesis protein-like protein [Methylobacterium sp. 4-46]WFT78491.1 glycosyltransferase family 61 protein [Methylobacterium nodulans]
MTPPTAGQVLAGTVVDDHAVAADYPDARRVAMRALQLWPDFRWTTQELVSFTARDVLVTSAFVPIDTRRSRMFLNQSYSGVETIFPTRFRVEEGRYRLEGTPVPCPGRHIVLGGPIDGVWYHWLFNWCPRLLLLGQLRPDLLACADLRIAVHPLALREPYRAVLDSFGLPAERFLVLDPGRDHLLEEACLVSFLDQNRLYPEMIRAFAAHLLAAWGLDGAGDPGPGPARGPLAAIVRRFAGPNLGARGPAPGAAPRGLFASRQDLPAPKRRIANFEEVAPVLARFGLDVVACGGLPAREQARLFRSARVVVGGHGSDLSNLLFCRPGTRVLVFESRFSVEAFLHRGLEQLCALLGLDYVLKIVPTDGEAGPGAGTQARINQDYRIDPDDLARTLAALTR